jgi:16S rRNA A1518/A1519 N6-dimethyltransferase RsmA/KsgA/DIM1 with predicted DNA glycosylase/AP lyase activity
MLVLVRDVRSLRTAIRPGVYTVLYYHGKKTKTIMSDTPAEIDENLRPISSFSGRVLVTGLGIGMVLQGLLMNKRVKYVTVLEKSRDVIKLVKPHYEKKFGTKRFTIIQADAFKYEPERQQFDYAWHDIWPMISSSNLRPMKQLATKYAHCVTYQGFWCEELCRKMQHAEREVKKNPDKFAHILGG